MHSIAFKMYTKAHLQNKTHTINSQLPLLGAVKVGSDHVKHVGGRTTRRLWQLVRKRYLYSSATKHQLLNWYCYGKCV
ncbi:hypothetical protein EG68_06667 [Paragonimus skrjabini miyazakii]|uniref:Uncharacterized protein n=1 Tax=Paragonimus skrjabini miyazakii TaxID=59628 RepID=A0A8S9YNP4_9TREM|nr:hypothetical protein EG68_06667 [Paragonimus skrjabini miyazakii]